MFWKKKKEVCFHDWKVSDFGVISNFMGDSDDIYSITCTKCKKTRNMDSYEFNRMSSKGFIRVSD